jgi:hypothetical protein
VDDTGDIFLNQGGIYNSSPYTTYQDQVLEFAAGAGGNAASIAVLHRGLGSTFNNVGLDGQELLVSQDLDDQGGGVVSIYNIATLHRIQRLQYSKWQSRAALGADMDADGNLYVLTDGPTGGSGIWVFSALKGRTGHVAATPSGNLGGSRTGFSGIASDVRVGP